MLIPALGRLSQIIGVYEIMSIPFWLLLWVLFFIPLVIFDIQTIKHLHKFTILGNVMIVTSTVIGYFLIGSPDFAEIIENIIRSF